MNQDPGRWLEIPTEARDSPLIITTVDGETAPTRGTFYTHPILLEIGANGHWSMISYEIANAGRYDFIIPFGWWNDEHPPKNITNPSKWFIEEESATLTSKMKRWRICLCGMKLWLTTKKHSTWEGLNGKKRGDVELETRPKPYWQYKELFEEKKAKMLAPRRTFDHAINLKEEAEPGWGPIYPMSAHALNELDKYIKKILAEGKIMERKSPYGPPILFFPQPEGSLQLWVDYRILNKLMILKKYPLPLMDEL